MSESVKLKCDIYWCQHNKKNEMSDKFQINLCNLSDAAVEALEKLGIEVKVGVDGKADMGRYIVVKSSNPIKVYDAEGDEITEQIGNGSKAKAVVNSYEWKYKNKAGISPSLKKIVVTDLVEFGVGDIDDDEVL